MQSADDRRVTTPTTDAKMRRSNRMLKVESSLVVLVPEAEGLVRSFRDLYDPVAAAGMPAHVTILYPFKPPDQIDKADLENLRSYFGRRQDRYGCGGAAE